MIHIFKHIIITFFIFILFSGISRSEIQKDSTRTDSVMTRGTWISGLNGYMASTSQNDQLSGGISGNFINNYSFEIRTGIVHSRRIVSGVLINTQRISNEGNGLYESEILGMGLWSRYFIGSMPYGKFYPELSVFYANLQENRSVNYGNFSVTESFSGNGVGMKTSIGFMYYVNKNIGLDVSYGVSVAKVWGDKIDFGTTDPYRQTTIRTSFIFSFGFIIMLNEFFF